MDGEKQNTRSWFNMFYFQAYRSMHRDGLAGLAATGNPVATKSTRRLRRFAKSEQWPISYLSASDPSDQDDDFNPFPPFLGSGPQAMRATQTPR